MNNRIEISDIVKHYHNIFDHIKILKRNSPSITPINSSYLTLSRMVLTDFGLRYDVEKLKRLRTLSKRLFFRCPGLYRGGRCRREIYLDPKQVFLAAVYASMEICERVLILCDCGQVDED